MRLRIHTLGAFSVQRGDTAISESAWRTQKNKALLQILFTHRGRALDREQLMEWLWPDRPPDAARRNLRVALSQLRRILEPELPARARSAYVLTTPTGYAWNTRAGYWLDADEFETLSAGCAAATPAEDFESWIANAERAKALYRGDYLEEERYADWATAERERLRESYFTLLTRMAKAYARQGRYGRAVSLCQEILVADRCRESIWCHLMLFHYHAGDPGRALEAFKACRAALSAELGVEPSPKTIALAGRIRSREVTGESVYPPPAAIERLMRLPVSMGRMPFVGRETEYARLVDHLKRAGTGQGHLALIEGEAGLGKTRLAEELIGFARREEAVVLEGRCRENDGRPYRPILDALRDAAATAGDGASPAAWPGPALSPTTLAVLSELIPELRRDFPNLPAPPALPPEQERTRLFEALTRGLLAAGAADPHAARSARPLLLFLDDLQWADSSTLAFLGHFVARARNEPALVLAAVRSEEAAASPEDGALPRLLWTLKRQNLLHRLALRPLSPPALSRLLRALSVAPEHRPQLGRWLHDESEGNPLFLVAVLQNLFEDGALTVDHAGDWRMETPDALGQASGVMPARMNRVIGHRLRRLRDEERQVLEAAAVVGREFQWSVLSRMRAWQPYVLLDHLDRLMATLLIRGRRHESYTFSHDKFRQAVYEDIPEAERGWLHGKAGDAIEALHADGLDEVADRLAHHFEMAGRPAEAFAYRLRAGWLALRLYASDEARRQYRSALALAGRGGWRPADGDLREAHERLGDIDEAAGQYAAARKAFEAARRHSATPADRVRLLYKLGHVDNRLGSGDRSRELLRQVVDEVDRLGVRQVGHTEAARLYARWAIVGSALLGRAESQRYARRAVGILEEHCAEALRGERPLPWAEYEVVHSVLINAGEAFRHWQRWSDAARLFQQSLAVAERQGDPGGIGYSCHNRGDVALAGGDFAGARGWYQRAVEAWERSGEAWTEMVAHTHLGLAWACEGRWEDALPYLERARAVGERMEPTQWLGEVCLWSSLAVLRSGGDDGLARAHLDRAGAVARAAGQALPTGLGHLAQSAAEGRAGRLEPAWEHYRQAQSLWDGESELAYYSRWILHHCMPPPLPDASPDC